MTSDGAIRAEPLIAGTQSVERHHALRQAAVTLNPKPNPAVHYSTHWLGPTGKVFLSLTVAHCSTHWPCMTLCGSSCAGLHSSRGGGAQY